MNVNLVSRRRFTACVRPWVVCIAAGALLFFSSGCSRHETGSPAEDWPTATVSVQVAAIGKASATEEVVGTVSSRLRSTLEAKVSGRIERMEAYPGKAVKRGDLLVQLDGREIQARLEQAGAVREQAREDLNRFSALRQQQAVTQAEFDAVQARFRVADASVREAETMLGYTKIAAPFDGVVTRKLADVGDLAAPGKPLVEMEDPRSLRFEAAVPESLINRIQTNATYEIHIGEQRVEGNASEIAPAADPGTRTFLVKFDLPADATLRAGQFGRATIPVAELAALRVPSSAVLRRGQMELAFVVADERAQLRLVKTGKRIGLETEIVSGISTGETVVISGIEQLRDGQPVKTRP